MKIHRIHPSALFLSTILILPRAHAQEVIVEATSLGADRIEASPSVTVLKPERQPGLRSPSVADTLRAALGAEVIQQGGAGQTTSVFIRGARSEDTLVLIDGAEANDAMSPAGGFDFSTISTEDIERIEVYRGPQSVRFGAGALGGVINIVTKTGKGHTQFSYLGELGTYSTFREAASTAGQAGSLDYALGANHFATKGFSAASKASGNVERDGAKAGAGSVKLGWAPAPAARVEATLRYTDARVDIDTFGGPGGDDPNNKTKTQQLVTGVRGSDRFLGDRLKTSLGLFYSKVDRASRNDPDAVSPTRSTDDFTSDSRKLQAETEYLAGEAHTLRLGLGYRDEGGTADSTYDGAVTAISHKRQSVAGGSFAYRFEGEAWFAEAGTRADHSSQAGSVLSHEASLGRNFASTGTKTFVDYGTGYKLASLYQLYSSYGDEHLKPEDSLTFEGGLEQALTDRATLTATAFTSRFRDLIDYDTGRQRYYNLAEARSRGLELQAELAATSQLRLTGRYTHLVARDQRTGLALLRRPRNVGALSARFAAESYELFSEYAYRGTRDDVDPSSFQRIRAKGYSLVSLGGVYRFKKWLKAHARVENLFNQSYEEVAGYGTAGRSVFVGLSGEF
jgi:vitamin B12 transporter